jgi:hypothetical protein
MLCIIGASFDVVRELLESSRETERKPSGTPRSSTIGLNLDESLKAVGHQSRERG